jgi:hypothetical protein
LTRHRQENALQIPNKIPIVLKGKEATSVALDSEERVVFHHLSTKSRLLSLETRALVHGYDLRREVEWMATVTDGADICFFDQEKWQGSDIT